MYYKLLCIYVVLYRRELLNWLNNGKLSFEVFVDSHNHIFPSFKIKTQFQIYFRSFEEYRFRLTVYVPLSCKLFPAQLNYK